MTSDARYLLVYTPTDEDAPKNVRLRTRDGALGIAHILNTHINDEAADRDGPPIGRWTVHEVGPEVP